MSAPVPSCYVPLGVVEIRRAETSDHPVIEALARRIWHACFRDMISAAQLEYMLTRRYRPEAMAAAVAAGELTYELLRVDGEPLAFAAHGPGPAPGEWKLQQLYVDPGWQSRGLGGRLLDHVETHARGLGRRHLVLTVNRGNTRAQAVYRKRGFQVREAAVFDIGNGFVMDDFVMVKDLAEATAARV